MGNADNKDRLGTLILVIGCTLWGISGTCGQYLFSEKGIESGWLVMVRMFISGVVLVAICLIRKDSGLISIWKSRKDTIRLLIFTFCGFLVSQYSYLTAIYYSNASTATVLQEVSPALIIFVVCLSGRRLPHKKELICVLLALTGTFLVATKGRFDSLALSREGLFWGLMSAVGIVLYSMTAGDLTSKYGSLPVTGIAMLIGGFVFGLVSGNYKMQVAIDFETLMGLFGVIILGSACAYTMYIAGVGMCGPVKAGMLGTIEPVSATIFSFLFLKTELTVFDILGAIMILSVVFILNIDFRKLTCPAGAGR